MKAGGKYLSLNQLAKSGILYWSDIATVRKYVERYPEIFHPRMRGGDGVSRRYVIAKKDAEHFHTLWSNGELKEFHKLTNAKKREAAKFVSVVYMPTLATRAKRLREEIEKAGYDVHFHKIETRREFMNVIYGTRPTYQTLIFVMNTEEKKLSFPEGELVSSTDMRRIGSNKGINSTAVIMWTDGVLPLFDKAFYEKGQVHFYDQIEFHSSEAEDGKRILKTLQALTSKDRTVGRIEDLIPRPSVLRGRK